jgi:hypothetical protein
MILSHVISDLAGKERDVGENLFEGRGQDIIRCGWSDLRGELKDMVRERMA